MRAELFVAICDRLNDHVPELKWIDMDWGQLELPDQSYPLQFDCCLISFPDIPWEYLTRGSQDGEVQILVRIGIDMYNDTHIADGVVAPDRAMAVQKLQLPNKINSALTGFEGPFFSKIVRTRSVEERRDDGLKVFNEYFVTRMKDNTALKPQEEVTGLGLALTGMLENNLR